MYNTTVSHFSVDTGFHSDYFYIVKHTLTAERIRILVNVSGETDIFDERVSRAIAFTADKVKLGYGGTILKVSLVCFLYDF